MILAGRPGPLCKRSFCKTAPIKGGADCLKVSTLGATEGFETADSAAAAALSRSAFSLLVGRPRFRFCKGAKTYCENDRKQCRKVD